MSERHQGGSAGGLGRRLVTHTQNAPRTRAKNRASFRGTEMQAGSRFTPPVIAKVGA